MRGSDLLLAHLAALPDLDDEDPGERPSARERLEQEVGPELAELLLARPTTAASS